MTIGDGLAIGLGMWAVVSLPLGIMFRDYKANKMCLEYNERNPDRPQATWTTR